MDSPESTDANAPPRATPKQQLEAKAELLSVVLEAIETERLPLLRAHLLAQHPGTDEHEMAVQLVEGELILRQFVPS